MKFVKFLKLLNTKIKKYDKLAQTNPFTLPRHITVVWVEDFPHINPDVRRD